jgi:hypothetical protein
VASLVNVTGAGKVHSETLRALTAEEMTATIEKV